MIDSFGYAALRAKAKLEPHSFHRRALRNTDILLEIDFAGICHSDIHQVREEWGRAIFPMVPGHEIVGRVVQCGGDVEKFAPGDLVGVGVYIDSCRECPNCRSGMSHYCDKGMIGTYNGYERDGITPTYGGYSTNYVIDQDYAVKVPSSLDLAGVAPLLCAGITLYSPLRHWGAKPGMKVAVMGLGGLGHMGVKFAVAMGADVSVISHSLDKKEDALAMGASDFIFTGDGYSLNREFDLILNTVSAEINLEPFIKSLKVDGTLVCIGLPGKPYAIGAGSLLDGRKRVAGSMIGSVGELQEMLDFCAEKKIVSDVEVISPDYINKAYDRCVASDVKYRFVIDVANWRKSLPK